MEREPIHWPNVDACHRQIYGAVVKRCKEKGDHIYAGSHEILGTATEEYHELIDAVKSNDRQQTYAELLDLAVVCLFGMASLQQCYKKGGKK